MKAITYYITIPFIYLISLLPFWLLYIVSDFFNFMIFTVFGYRKEVIITNLRKSFPEKSEQEITKIHREFKQFFCDLVVETLKTLTISKKEAVKRCRIKNPEFLEQLYSENKKIIWVLGHYGNWELAGAAMSYQMSYQLYVIYKPLSNVYFDKLLHKMRTRSGTKLHPMKDTFRRMVGLRNSDETSATAFIADQASSKDNSYWTQFLNQDTAVFWGTEVIASKLNYPLVYMNVSRIKRGFYEVSAEMLCENPKDTTKGEISEMHTKRLEKDIIAQPAYWLWTHKRWKHKRTSDS